MEHNLHETVLALGQVRLYYRQAVDFFAGQSAFSWTANDHIGRLSGARGFAITRALRYLARSTYIGAGDNSRYAELHTTIRPSTRAKPVSVAAGSKRSQPTVRNRLSSFGSRVQPLNSPVQGAE